MSSAATAIPSEDVLGYGGRSSSSVPIMSRPGGEAPLDSSASAPAGTGGAPPGGAPVASGGSGGGGSGGGDGGGRRGIASDGVGFGPAGTTPERVAGGILEVIANRFHDAMEFARPWAEYADTREFSVPDFADITITVERNLSYFRGNYELIAAFWLVVAVLFHLGEFFFAGLFLYLLARWARKKIISQGELTGGQKVGVAIIAFIIIALTEIGRPIAETVGMTFISVLAHAIFREPVFQDGDAGVMA